MIWDNLTLMLNRLILDVNAIGMNKIMKITAVLLFCFCWFSANGGNAKPQPRNVLVIGLDTLQFSSNIFYIDELAHYNNVGIYEVVKLYNKRLMDVLREFDHDQYKFVIADSADKAAVHAVSVFVDLENDYGDEFQGIAPAEGHGQVLFDLMEKHNADYVLSINAYQIYHRNPPSYVSYDIKADHIIHYDIFNRALSNIHGGNAPMTSNAVEAIFMGSHYREFARGITLWLQAHEKSLENNRPIKENFNLLRDQKYINASALGLSASFDGPYGLVGVHYSRLIGRNVDVNTGLGYDFSGFKVGFGGSYYFRDIMNRRLKPLVGFNYSFASGNTFDIGGRKDDYGTQLNPDDVSTFRIYSDHTLHFQSGISYWMEYSMLSLTVGYSYPIRGRWPELVSGKESAGRMNFVRAINPGGLGITLRYSFFINQRFLYRFW
jgi:hypothetical protein